MSMKAFRSLCVALLGLVSLVPSAHATSITYTATGTGSDGALSASAAFVTSTGLLQITLSNTLSASSIISSGQALSDISFTLSNPPGTLGATTASGQMGNVSSTGVVTYTSGSPLRFLGQGPAPPNGSGAFSIVGSTITMEAIGGGQPSEMILPFLANGGTYTNVNNGVQNFDPYTIGPATFTLALSGVTAGTTISNVNFSFGTGPDTFLPGVPSTPAVPETSSLLMLGTGIVGAAGMIRRRLAA
jgi:hypothetical protein